MYSDKGNKKLLVKNQTPSGMKKNLTSCKDTKGETKAGYHMVSQTTSLLLLKRKGKKQVKSNTYH